jgi:hypothetical protein
MIISIYIYMCFVTVFMTIFFFTLTMNVAHGDVKHNDVKHIVITVGGYYIPYFADKYCLEDSKFLWTQMS